MEGRYVWNLNVRTFPIKLGLVIAVLVIVHVTAMTLCREHLIDKWFDVHTHYWQFSMFDLDQEEGFGTWFSAVLLLLVGRLLLFQASWLKRQGDKWSLWWLVLGIGFVYLSIDEIVGLHEYLNTFLDIAGSNANWTKYGAMAAGLVAVAYLPWLWKQPAHFQLAALVGGALYVGGAVGIEHWTDWYDTKHLLETTDYAMWVALEEAMEMIGPVVFLRGLLVLMAGDFKGEVALGV